MKRLTLTLLFLLLAPSFALASTYTRTLSVGSQGSDVVSLQELLKSQGFLSASATGYFGALTAAALSRFQAAHGIPAVGRVGPQTLGFLNGFGSGSSASGSSSLSLGSSGSSVVTLQQELVSLGYLNTTPTGYFGPLTYAAVVELQNSNGISPTGTVGSQTQSLIASLAQSGSGGVSVGTPCTSGAVYDSRTGEPCSAPVPTPVPSPVPVSDTNAPDVAVTAPSGTLASGTTQVSLIVTTDENAACAYGTNAGQSYSSMALFSDTGGRVHDTLVTGLQSGFSYTYYVRCSDTSGNVSGSATISFAVAAVTSSGGGGGSTPAPAPAPSPTPTPPADTTAPTIPTGLTASAVATSQINLSWSASTDNVGVALYRIYRSGTQVGTSVTTSYHDTGLTAATQYAYTVKAVDAANNSSNASASVNATTQANSSPTPAPVPPPTPAPTPTPTPPPGNSVTSCTSSSGGLTLNAKTTRASGISPLLVFFDASGSTDSSAAMSAFQDVQYSWNFGDTGSSGQGSWTYGSNPGGNSKNSALGGIAAHLYITGADATYPVTVTATDGTHTASCQLAVTAYNPSGSNGFAGANTTCVSASGTPVAGQGGCPAGAAVLNSSSFNTALGSTHFGNGKQVLFKCGDTFSGDAMVLNGVKWSIGAYGSCQGSKSGRPVFSDSNTGGALVVGYTSGDGRIADIDFEGNGSGAAAVTTYGGQTKINYQITLDNLNSSGNSASYAWSQGAQWGLIDSVQDGMRTSIGTFVNYNENNPGWSGNAFNNLDYQAIVGDKLDGHGNQVTGGGEEVLRLSSCRMCVIADNTIENANNIGGVLKLHNGNTNNSLPTWTGIYTEFVEISDNWFGGTSGGDPIDIEPQNNNDDERLRDIVFERNIITNNTGAWGGEQMRTSVSNETLRDNVFVMNGGGAQIYPIYAVNLGRLGKEPQPTNLEVYNNTIYMPISEDGTQTGIALGGLSLAGPPSNAHVENNLFYSTGGTHKTVLDNGTNDTVSNNSASFTAANPGFTNGSGSFSRLSDFRPTASYSGATGVPVFTDALMNLWNGAWDLGAVHH